MKNANELFKDINSTLDGYHYYNEEEIKENRELFISAINSKDTDYINQIISLFDEEIEEEKAIIDNINYLMSL